MAFHIVRGDVVKMKVDAIVNAANTSLQIGGGVCGAVFRTAGEDQLRRECERIGGCEAGKAVITRGFALPAKHIIHAVGPIWRGGLAGEAIILRECYKSSLEIAKKYRFSSIAFPLISSGTFGYPKDQALNIAVDELGKFALTSDMEIFLVIYNAEDFMLETHFRRKIMNYIEEYKGVERGKAAPLSDEHFKAAAASASLEDNFCRKANITRKDYLRMMVSPLQKRLGKNELLSIAIGLELDLQITLRLLAKFGYTLDVDRTEDLIVQYFIENREFNIFEINKALVGFGYPEL